MTALVVTALVVTGCAATPDPTGPQGAPSPSATAAAEQQRETGLTPPAMVFGGKCDALFTDAELASVMGEPLALSTNHFAELWGGDATFNQLGAIECTWKSESTRVIALVLPEGAVDYAPQDAPCGGSHDTDLLSCPMEAVVNGIRLSGLSTLGLDPTAAAAARDALVGIFSTKAAAQSPVPVPLPAIGSWLLPPDCTAAVAGADFSAVPGLGATATAGEGYGYGKDITQAEQALRGNWSTFTCLIMGESVELEFVPIGGARWREQAIAARADASPLSLDGVEAAYAVPYQDGATLVYAFSGPNMLVFPVKFTKNAAGIATALIASLDATAVS